MDGLAPRKGHYTLIMLAHPECPCTRASIAELDRLLACATNVLDAHVAFLDMEDQAFPWSQSALVAQAGSIPGVEVHRDTDGTIAQHFGARTSGYTVLYGRQGELLFEGGLTSSRGHEGLAIGHRAILEHLDATPGAPDSASTFGCGLERP